MKSLYQMLRPEEVELLVCGTETLDLHELRKATEYDGYRFDDSIIWYEKCLLFKDFFLK